MLFFTLSNTNIRFLEQQLLWQTYTIAKNLPTNRWVKVIDRKDFATATSKKDEEAFIMHITFFFYNNYHKIQLASLFANETPVTMLLEYIKFADVFSPKSVAKLSKHTNINDHAIDLVKSQQPSYRSIYSLGSIELEILKIYIKINLANNFICPFKSPVNTSILFVRKPNSSFWLYINYQGLNNLIIED